MQNDLYYRITVIVLSIIIVFSTLYKNFFSPLKTLKDYYRRASNFELIQQRKRAIDIMKIALNKLNLQEQDKCGLLLIIGDYFFKDGNYDNANIYYSQALDILLSVNFYYSNSIIKILKSYIYSNQKETAIELYNNFLSRKSYDPNFIKIKNIKKFLEE